MKTNDNISFAVLRYTVFMNLTRAYKHFQFIRRRNVIGRWPLVAYICLRRAMKCNTRNGRKKRS